MDGEAIRVLMIDDNPAAFNLMWHLLAEVDVQGARIDLEHANVLSLGLRRLMAGDVDLVLLDILLPDSRGFDAFTTLHTEVPDVPVVILSGIDDEKVALKMVRDGAQDYLVKGEVTPQLLVRTIRCAVERTRGRDVGEARAELPGE